MLEGHKDNVNGVAFTPDGKSVVTAGYDATLRIWPLAGGAPTIVTLPTPLNAVAVAPDGEIVAAGADGKVYFLDRERRSARARSRSAPVPIIAIAISPDGKLVAAAGIRGSVAIIDRATRKLERTLVGPGLPVWSVAFFPDSRTLLTGGTDRMIRRWDAINGRADRRRAASARRTIRSRPMRAIPARRSIAPASPATRSTPDDGVRAGPTLHGIFGRRIATLPGYNFSEALQEDGHRLDAGDGVEAVRGRPQRPTRPAPRCRSRASARRRTARADAVSGEDDE